MLRQRQPREGKRTHPVLYKTWINIKSRCYDPNYRGYHNYGGRGITISPLWLGPDGFATFLRDVGNKPGPEYSLDRIDNNGNYEPGNCRWATAKEQGSNRRNNRLVRLLDGRVMTITQAAELCGKDRKTLSDHLSKGRSIEYAMERHK